MNALRYCLLCTATLLIAAQGLLAQKICATDELVNESLRNNPELQRIRAEIEAEALREDALFRAGRPATDNVIVIPIVFHIMHINGAENVSDAFIQTVVDRLNRDFSKRNADTSLVLPFFQSRIGNARIEFRLAQKDPDGNCTKGITRTFAPGTTAADDQIKLLKHWPTTRYLNAWIVRDIALGGRTNLPPGSFVAGYAYLPGTAPRSPQGYPQSYSVYDGVMVRADNLDDKTLTHEIGHYFNLQHPFVGTVSQDANCSLSDGVADTPPTRGTFSGCNRTVGRCGDSIPNTENFMDYATCSYMFTKGQTNRMRVSALSMVANRVNLSLEANLISTGTNDGYQGLPCVPVAVLNMTDISGCTDNPVTLNGSSYNTSPSDSVRYKWITPGADIDTAMGATVTVTYPTPGRRDVTFIAYTSTGGDTIVKQGLVTITPGNTGLRAPYVEDFNADSIFDQSLNPQVYWTKNNTTAQTNTDNNWTFVNINGFQGSGGLRIRPNRIGGTPGIASISTPMINLNRDSTQILQPNIFLRFSGAARPSDLQPTTRTDVLRMMISRDCGATYTTLRSLSRTTTPSLYNSGVTPISVYVPTSESQWRLWSMPVPAEFTTGQVRVKIEIENGGGGAVYIDDFAISNVRPNQIALRMLQDLGLAVYPNPIDAQSVLAFQAEKEGAYMLQFINSNGQLVATPIVEVTGAGLHQIPMSSLTKGLTKGIYLVRLSQDGSQSLPVKIIVP